MQIRKVKMRSKFEGVVPPPKKMAEMLKEEVKKFVLNGLDNFTTAELDEFWEKKKLFKEGKIEDVPIIFLGLSTKDICNYNCIFCYGPEFRGKEKRKPLSLDEHLKLIDEAAKLGVKSVIYCGNGEPTIDRDLPGMISHAHGKGLANILISNGQVMGYDKEAQELHGMDAKEFTSFLYNNNVSILLHIESLSPGLYEKITGVRGSFERLTRALTNIRECGFTKSLGNFGCQKVTRLAISSVTLKWNFFELPELKDFAHSINAQYLCKFPSFLGNLTAHEREFFVPSEDSTLWLRDNYVRKLSEKPESITVDNIHCGAWHYGVVVGNNGDIRTCYSAAQSIGNVKENSLKSLLKLREATFAKHLVKGVACHVKSQWYKEDNNDK